MKRVIGMMALMWIVAILALTQPASASQVITIHNFDRESEGAGVAALAIAPDGRLFCFLDQSELGAPIPILYELSPPTSIGKLWNRRVIYRVPATPGDGSPIDIASMLISRNGHLIYVQHSRNWITLAESYAIYELIPPSTGQSGWSRRSVVAAPQINGRMLQQVSLAYADSGNVIFGYGYSRGLRHQPSSG